MKRGNGSRRVDMLPKASRVGRVGWLVRIGSTVAPAVKDKGLLRLEAVRSNGWRKDGAIVISAARYRN